MKFGTINSRWLGLDPHHRLGAEFWLAVCAEFLAAGITPPDSADDDAVRAAIAKVDAGST